MATMAPAMGGPQSLLHALASNNQPYMQKKGAGDNRPKWFVFVDIRPAASDAFNILLLYSNDIIYKTILKIKMFI